MSISICGSLIADASRSWALTITVLALGSVPIAVDFHVRRSLSFEYVVQALVEKDIDFFSAYSKIVVVLVVVGAEPVHRTNSMQGVRHLGIVVGLAHSDDSHAVLVQQHSQGLHLRGMIL